MLFNILMFLLFALLWGAFAAALLFNQGSLDNIWHQVRGLPLPIQALVWLLFLPVVVGLWIWEAPWPALLRLVLVGGVGVWNVWMFFPWKG